MIAQYTEGENVKNKKGYCDATSFAQICTTPCVSPTNLVVVGDKAMLAHVHTVFEAE